MYTSRTIVLSAAILMIFGWMLPVRGEEGDAGVVKMFNGKDLDGWVIEGPKTSKEGGEEKPIWTVKDGVIACTGKVYDWMRYDKQKYDDFVFHVEYRMLDAKSNSGLGIRCVPYAGSRDTRPSFASYEVQLLNDTDKPPSKGSTGSLYRYVAPTAKPIKGVGEWNTMEVTCRGPQITIVLNGEKILDLDQTTKADLKNKPLSGYLSIQSHSGPVEFRNLWVKPMAKPAKAG
jgi:hypothetical protein